MADNTNTAATARKTRKSRPGRKPANKRAYRVEGGPLLTSWPADFDAAKHKPLEEGDFAPEVQYVFWDNRKEHFAAKAAECERKAEYCRKYPSIADREKIARAASLAAKLEEMRKELEACGLKIGEV